MRMRWRTDAERYYAYRTEMMMVERVMPYCEGGRCFALPFPIVYCESGADGHNPAKPSGYYGILLSTWAAYGGYRFSAAPWEASDLEQAIIAHKLLMMYGLSPWECASIVGLI